MASREVSHRIERIKWRIMDGLIGAKERLPGNIYQSPPPWLGYILIIPGLLLVGFLFVGMLLLTYYSFLQFDPIEFMIYEFTLENWENFMTTDAYQRILLRTLGFAVLITVLSVILAFPYAYLTIRTESAVLRKLLLISVFVPFFTGVIVRAYGWLIILGQNGLVNAVFGLFGLGPYRIIATPPGVVIGLLQIMVPFAIIMLAPAIQNIDRSLERAASNCGANRLQTFRYVVLPLAKPGIAGATIVVFTITAAAYAIPALVGGGRVDFIANVIFRALFDLANYPLAATLSVILVVVASLLVLVIFYTIGAGTLALEETQTEDADASDEKTDRLRPVRSAIGSVLTPIRRLLRWPGFLSRATNAMFRKTRRLPGDRPIVSSIVALEIVFLMLPTIIVLVVSFQPGDIVRFPPDGFSLRWYYLLPEQDRFIAGFWRSVLAATGATAIAIPIGLLTGLGLMRYKVRFEKIFHIYFLLPFTVPLVVSGVILLIILGEMGYIGQLWTVALALAIIEVPFVIWSVTSRINALNPELESAAKNLGAEELQTFTNVTFPAIVPGLITGGLIVFILSLNEFIVSLIITTSANVTLPVLIYTAIRANISPLIAAVASVYVIVAFLAVIVADRLVGLDQFLKS